PDQGLAKSENQFERFGRLKCADQAGEHTQDPGLGAVLYAPRLGWPRKEASVARTPLGGEHRDLTLEAIDAAVYQRATGQHACVIQEIPRGKVVSAVDYDVVRRQEIQRVLGHTRSPIASTSTCGLIAAIVSRADVALGMPTSPVAWSS